MKVLYQVSLKFLDEWQDSYELDKDLCLWLKRTIKLFYVSAKVPA